MSEYLERLKRYSEHKKLIYNTEPWKKAIDHIKLIESQLKAKEEELKAIHDRRQGASLNVMMEWSVKELAETVIDLLDENNELRLKEKK